MAWGAGNSVSTRAALGLQGHRKPRFVSSNLLKRPPNAARNILADDMTRNSVDMIELGKALRESGFYASKKLKYLAFMPVLLTC
jgi:hypothetical protein